MLCLQETKCPDDLFPAEGLRKRRLSASVVHAGQKGYNGVAILSRLPFRPRTVDGALRARRRPPHRASRSAPDAGAAAGIAIHNFYVPAGGDMPDPRPQPEIRPQARLPRRDAAPGATTARRRPAPAILVGDLNVAPLEHDVWSHKQLLDVVSHTPVETDALETLRQEARLDRRGARTSRPSRRRSTPGGATASPDWAAADKGRRLDHVWLSPDLAGTLRAVDVARETRGWERPSDHVPVTAVLEL